MIENRLIVIISEQDNKIDFLMISAPLNLFYKIILQ